MNKEKELREYLKSKTKEEIIDLYIQETFETNLMIEDLQKDIECLTNATNYYYDENNKLKGCVKMSKYWHIEDGQVCWRTPYADLRGCDGTMLVACLNERDEKIADLKKQLTDVKNSCNYYMKRSNDLVLKLAEKDKRIRKLNLEAQKYFEDAYCNNFQIKAKTDFAIEQLEKMKYNLLDISNGWWLCFKDGTQYMTHRELEGCVKEVIDNQIQELRGQK